MKNKKILIIILALFVIAGGGIGGYFWYQGQNYVSTDDARINGDIYRVMPRIPGKLTSLEVEDGDFINQDSIIGKQETKSLSSSQLELATLRAPISGVVIKTLAKEGEVLAPGQPVAMVVDPSNLYVSANIEETDLKKVRIGETVDITVDAYPDLTLTGTVREIGDSTNSMLSALPAMNTSGNFTKVTQRLPIEIEIAGDEASSYNLSPGLNTTIRIHIKE